MQHHPLVPEWSSFSSLNSSFVFDYLRCCSDQFHYITFSFLDCVYPKLRIQILFPLSEFTLVQLSIPFFTYFVAKQVYSFPLPCLSFMPTASPPVNRRYKSSFQFMVWKQLLTFDLYFECRVDDRFPSPITAAIPIVLIVLATVFHSTSKFQGLGPQLQGLGLGFRVRVRVRVRIRIRIRGRCMSTSAWCPLENAFVCLRAHARKYSGAAKTRGETRQPSAWQPWQQSYIRCQGPAVACDLLLASQAPAPFTARHALAHGFNWQVVEDSIGLVCCSWVSQWGGQLERRERSCFWGLHASFVLSSAPLHLFSWHSWFREALSASCFLFLTETSYTRILRHINSFSLILLDAFSSRFFKTNVFFLYTLFSSAYISFLFPLASVSFVLFSQVQFQAFSKLPLRCPLRHIQ